MHAQSPPPEVQNTDLSSYLQLVRRLIKVYTLEPAGSHGVWGLDDHFFVPFIFGSAQLAPAITTTANIPTEGSIKGAPDPTAIMKPASVEFWRDTNLYFDAIGFIYDVKTGPFWEHSPVLYDISGVKAGWAKINKV
jgi:serine/threonine-protein phosphatase 2A activator